MRKSLSFLVVLFLILSQFTFLELSFALTAADVIVTPPIAGKVASYNIQFTLGTSSGYAIPETGYIKISFPTGTTLPTSMDKSCVTVNGVATPFTVTQLLSIEVGRVVPVGKLIFI